MHLLIPFAATLSEAGRQPLGRLNLPHLQALLSRTQAGALDLGAAPGGAGEMSLSPPHERALAQALGWQGADGELPWAARAAAADGLPVGAQAWGLLSPTHWRLGTEQVSLADPDALALDAETSRALFDTVAPLFRSEGFEMHWGAPLRWYAAHDSLDGMATASLDRVIGRPVDPWMVPGAQGRLLRRLQSETQMLLHEHAVNEERAARDLPAVNSFWLSGCGRAQIETGAAPRIADGLRGPALAEDWTAWVDAWHALDAGPLTDLLAHARRGGELRLTLCGERQVLDFVSTRRGPWQRLRAHFQPPALATLWERL